MSHTFTCPSCGAPLDYAGNGAATIPCPYCYSSVIVPAELRSQAAQAVSPQLSMALAGQAGKLRELSNLVRARQRDQAVNLYAQTYGTSAGDAEKLVDQLMQNSSVVITSNVSAGANVYNISTPAGTYTVSQTPAAPYAYPAAVYAASAAQAANAANASKRWLWYFGCLFLFIIGVTVVTTIVPLIGVLGSLWLTFK